jgi:alpha-N-arabinofuranosidase
MRLLKYLLLLSSFVLGLTSTSLSATITVDATQIKGSVNRLMFGNAQPFGHGDLLLDESTWDFDSEALHMVQELSPTLLRFPGGLKANEYFWEDGIGSQDQRPSPRRNQFQPYSFHYGTDEHMALCQEIGAEAFFTVNYGTGLAGDTMSTEVPLSQRVQRAADWVEYCNTPNDGSNPNGGVDWAARRAQNGHSQPYNIIYWEIGNEIYGEPVTGRADDVQDYAYDLIQFSQAMKAVDPRVKIGAVGAAIARWRQWWNGSTQEWNSRLLEIAGDHIDLLVVHCHYPGPTDVTGPTLYRAGMAGGEQVLTDLREVRAQIDAHGYSEMVIVPGENAFFAGVDQWHLNATLLAGLHYADLTMIFLEHGQELGIEFACGWTLTSNTPSGDIACRWSPPRRFANPEYYAQLVLKRHLGDQLVSHSIDCGIFATDEIFQVRPRSDVPELAACASIDSSGQVLSLAVVNRQLDDAVLTDIQLENFQSEPTIDLWTLDGPSIIADNESDPACVTLVSSSVEKSDSTFQYLFPAHSLTVLKFHRVPEGEEDREEEPEAPPVISGLTVHRRDGTSALISWQTDRPANSILNYGIAPGQLDHTVEACDLVTDHELLLESLSSETIYYYRVISRDEWGLEVCAQGVPFWMPDITGPVIEDLEVTTVSESTAVIRWLTSEPADARVRYGIDPELEHRLILRALALEHHVVLADLQAATAYRFQVSGTDSAGNPGQIFEGQLTTASPHSSLEELGETGGLPGEYGLSQNYPNPFNGSTTIRYRLAESGPVTMRIFNARGQEVITLADGHRSAGEHQLSWDARDGQGREAASGVYFCCLQTDDDRWMRKMILLR